MRTEAGNTDDNELALECRWTTKPFRFSDTSCWSWKEMRTYVAVGGAEGTFRKATEGDVKSIQRK